MTERIYEEIYAVPITQNTYTITLTETQLNDIIYSIKKNYRQIDETIAYNHRKNPNRSPRTYKVRPRMQIEILQNE